MNNIWINIRQLKSKKVIGNRSKLLQIFATTLPLLFSFILFSSCAKSLTDEGFPEAGNLFTDTNYSDFAMNRHYENEEPKMHEYFNSNDVGAQYPYKDRTMYDRDPDALIKGMNQSNDYLPIKVLQYKILANPSKRDKYEKEIQKIEQQFLDNRLNFLREFYTDLYQKNQKDFTRQYKSRCSINIIHGRKISPSRMTRHIDFIGITTIFRNVLKYPDRKSVV